MQEPAMIIENLTKSYAGAKGVPVLRDLSFEVPAGAVTGFLGPNGAGKTTAILCILDLLYPDGGNIRLLGKSIRDPELRARIGVMLDKPNFYGFLTGEETLEVHGRLLGMEKTAIRSRVEELTETFQLRDFIKKRASTYSLGTLQKLSFAQAVIGNPDLLILDEPLSGLDPLVMAEVRRYILNYGKQGGKTIFLSSHLLSEVEQLCEHVVMIHKGKLVKSGPLAELLKGRSKFRVSAAALPSGLDSGRFFTREIGGGAWDVIVKDGALSESQIKEALGCADCQRLPLTLEDLFFEEAS